MVVANIHSKSYVLNNLQSLHKKSFFVSFGYLHPPAYSNGRKVFYHKPLSDTGWSTLVVVCQRDLAVNDAPYRLPSPRPHGQGMTHRIESARGGRL